MEMSSTATMTIRGSTDFGQEDVLETASQRGMDRVAFLRDAPSGAGSPRESLPESDASATDDIPYFFERMRLPEHRRWARAVQRAGYMDMDALTSTDVGAVANELDMPSGVREALAAGMRSFAAGTFDRDYSMPIGDVDATAPRQTPARRTSGLTWGMLTGAGAFGMLALFVLCDCLGGDAEITMADRRKKKIKDIEAGDKVLAYNQGRTKVKTVVQVTKAPSSVVRPISCRGKSGDTFSVNATEGHPFFTKDHGWAVLDAKPENFSNASELRTLQKGDTLVLRQSGVAEVVDIGKPLPPMEVYNLVLDGPGAFFVHDILSHSGLLPTKAA